MFELLAAALDDVVVVLGGEKERQWVKDFGVSDKTHVPLVMEA